MRLRSPVGVSSFGDDDDMLTRAFASSVAGRGARGDEGHHGHEARPPEIRPATQEQEEPLRRLGGFADGRRVRGQEGVGGATHSAPPAGGPLPRF